jgi:hypothetical protein
LQSRFKRDRRCLGIERGARCGDHRRGSTRLHPSGSGAVGGAAAGTALALAGPNGHSLNLDTSALGPRSGAVNATSTSVAVANGTFNQPINYTVLDHAAGEFVDPTGLHSLTIDFGTLLQNSGTANEIFEITNLNGAYRADLDLTSYSESGDAANRFGTNLAPFFGLMPGATSSPFNVLFATDQLGNSSATYLIDVADEAGVFGGTSRQLQLNVLGSVMVPEPSTLVLAAMAAVACSALHWRRIRRRAL